MNAILKRIVILLMAAGIPVAAHAHAGHDHETTGGTTAGTTEGTTTGGTAGSDIGGTAGDTTGTTGEDGGATGEGTGTAGTTTGAGSSATDQDDDGVADWKETELGTDPADADSDDDGVIDSLDCAATDASRRHCQPLPFPEPDLNGPQGEEPSAEDGSESPLTTLLESGPNAVASNGGCSLILSKTPAISGRAL